MSYKAGIIKAITELKERTGSSYIAIKKHMQANMPVDKKWMNATYLNALKKGVEDGILLKLKASYKLSAEGKKTTKADAAAPKTKKSAPKKAAPKKKSAPKKKAVPKKKAASEKTATKPKAKATRPKKAAAAAKKPVAAAAEAPSALAV